MRRIEAHEVTVEIRLRDEEESARDTEKRHGYEPGFADTVEAMEAKHGQWGWCTVELVVKWEGLEASTYLGQCSYASEEDFLQCNYFKSMLNEAVVDLNMAAAMRYDEAKEFIAMWEAR